MLTDAPLSNGSQISNALKLRIGRLLELHQNNDEVCHNIESFLLLYSFFETMQRTEENSVTQYQWSPQVENNHAGSFLNTATYKPSSHKGKNTVVACLLPTLQADFRAPTFNVRGSCIREQHSKDIQRTQRNFTEFVQSCCDWSKHNYACFSDKQRICPCKASSMLAAPQKVNLEFRVTLKWRYKNFVSEAPEINTESWPPIS